VAAPLSQPHMPPGGAPVPVAQPPPPHVAAPHAVAPHVAAPVPIVQPPAVQPAPAAGGDVFAEDPFAFNAANIPHAAPSKPAVNSYGGDDWGF
jgi:hypothetical protein